FFTFDLAHRLRASGIAADIVHANNVLAHVPDLNGFVAGIAAILKADGIAVIEFPYLLDLVDRLEFDTVYHEHLAYFALTPLLPVFARQGLQIFDVERLPLHGGSLRIFARRAGSRPAANSVERMLETEREWGVCNR